MLFSVANAADATEIVALGASNTYGMGVERDEAYPARLQRLLRAKGIQANVANAGVNGSTTAQMLARLDAAAPAGTVLVILQPGTNDAYFGVEDQTQGNIAAMQARLGAKGAKLIIVPNALLAAIRSASPSYDFGDGVHLTADGYAELAARLLPEVLAAIGK